MYWSRPHSYKLDRLLWPLHWWDVTTETLWYNCKAHFLIMNHLFCCTKCTIFLQSNIRVKTWSCAWVWWRWYWWREWQGPEWWESSHQQSPEPDLLLNSGAGVEAVEDRGGRGDWSSFLCWKNCLIQSCEKVHCIFQHGVLGTFMTVSRVLPSYPPTYHTREVIPTDSWSYCHPSVTQDTNIYILSALYFLLRLQT